MGYKPTGGKPGRPKRGTNNFGDPVGPPKPEPSGTAISLAESRRADAVRRLEHELSVLDRQGPIGASGQALPEHLRRQRADARQDLAEKLGRLRALSGYDLAAEFAPSLLPPDGPLPEPVSFAEGLVRGQYIGQPVKGGQVTPADPTHMRQYRERMDAQAAEAEHQERVKRGQEAMALEALARQEATA